MNKVALITDTHFGARNDSEIIADYQDRFYAETFFPTLKERGITTILHGGDIFERRKYTNHKTLHRARKMFFDKLREEHLHMHLLIGNHDTYHKNNNNVNSPSLFLGEYDEFITYYESEPATLDNEFGPPIHLIPWINRENFESTIQFVKDSKPGIVLGHFEFEGFEMHNGIVNEHGMSTEAFRRHHLVLSGHFHTQSQSGNVQYIGNPFEFNWNDYNDPRGFWILDLESLEMEFVQNPERMHYELKYDDKGVIEEPQTDLKDKFVKIKLYSKSKDAYAYDLWFSKIVNSGPADIQVVDMEDLSFRDISEEEIEEANKSTDYLIKSYVDSLEGVDQPIKDSTLGLLQEVYVDATSE